MLGDDKRRHARAPIWGVARVTGSAVASEIRAVRDLSLGGLGLGGGGPLPVGLAVELDARLFGESVALTGRVAWAAGPDGRSAIGIELDRREALAKVLGGIDTRLAARVRRGRALLIEAAGERAALLAEYLWSHGYEVEQVATPLAAIDRLAQGDVDLVAIGPHLSTCSGGEFATFVAESFPRIHRLVVAHTADGTGPLTVASAFEADHPTSGHAVVCADGARSPRG